jgi:hypothetical protein
VDIGRFTGGLAGYDLDGIVDEARILNVARTPEWIATQHESMTDALISYGAEAPYLPPGTFVLVDPTDGEPNVVLEPTLDWSDSADADSYTVQISTETGFSSGLIVDQTLVLASTFDVPASTLAPGVQYYWRVTAVNPQGATLCSDTYFAFTTAPLPGPFSLVDPGDADLGMPLEPTLDWGDSADADTYIVHVATDSGFSDLVVNAAGVASSAYAVPPSVLDAGTDYYWRITAVNTQGSTPCDDVYFPVRDAAAARRVHTARPSRRRGRRGSRAHARLGRLGPGDRLFGVDCHGCELQRSGGRRRRHGRERLQRPPGHAVARHDLLLDGEGGQLLGVHRSHEQLPVLHHGGG